MSNFQKVAQMVSLLMQDNACILQTVATQFRGLVHQRHSSHDFATPPSILRAGWQAEMASIEFWIP